MRTLPEHLPFSSFLTPAVEMEAPSFIPHLTLFRFLRAELIILAPGCWLRGSIQCAIIHNPRLTPQNLLKDLRRFRTVPPGSNLWGQLQLGRIITAGFSTGWRVGSRRYRRTESIRDAWSLGWLPNLGLQPRFEPRRSSSPLAGARPES